MDINIININDFNIDDIILSKSVFINTNKKKISIGYKENTELYLLTPLLTNNINFENENKYQFIKIIFDPLLGQILNFYNIILSLEKYIQNHIIKNNNKYVLNSIIKNDRSDIFDDNLECIKTILLKLNNYKIYDNNSNECSLSSLKNGWNFKALIKIDYIWIDTDKKKFGLNINLVQLKIYQPIIQQRCLIDNDVTIRRKIYKSLEPNRPIVNVVNEFKEIEKEKEKEKEKEEIEDNNINIFKPPNPLELMKMKNSLKKVIN